MKRARSLLACTLLVAGWHSSLGVSGTHGGTNGEKKALYPLKDAAAKNEIGNLESRSGRTKKATSSGPHAHGQPDDTMEPSETQPHHFIGHSLFIDSAIAENIIANAANALMQHHTEHQGSLEVLQQHDDDQSDANEDHEPEGSLGELAQDSQDDHESLDHHSRTRKTRKEGSAEDSLRKTSIPHKTSKGRSHQAGNFWATEWKEVDVCDDSCSSAKDGQCSDGRNTAETEVLCDLGTDCSDCGSWTYLLEKSEGKPPKPVQALIQKGIKVFARNTSTVPSIRMPYTDWNLDVDVSGQMHYAATVELGLTQTMHVAMAGKCLSNDGQAQLFLDIGSNFGYYAFYAAAHGCRVIAWEPVPHFRDFLTFGRQLNQAEELIQIRDRIVSDEAGKEFDMHVPGHGIWGTASVNGINKQWGVDDTESTIKAVTERADSLAHENILVAKIDVEGFEPQAMRSLKRLFDNFRIDNIFMEYSPGIYEVRERWDDSYEFPDMLAYLLHSGYTIAHITDTLKVAQLLKERHWKDPLPPLREVTKENVAYDLVDVFKFKLRDQKECWVQKLRDLGDHWGACLMRPEDLNPKGFRGNFGYNTNIWATLEDKNFQVEGTASFFDPKQPPELWFNADNTTDTLGIGIKLCQHVPEPFKVKSRCRCAAHEHACNDEAKVVEELIKSGKGPMTFAHKTILEDALVYLGQQRRRSKA